MIRGLSWGVLVGVLLAVTACAVRLPEGQNGVVPMIPFTDGEHGIRGNAPLEGWSDQAILLQQSFSGTEDELVAAILEQTDLVRIPRSTGTYQGAHLTWSLYTCVTRVKDAGPDLYRLDLGMAHVEQDARYYMVVLITLPMEYEANRALYRTVFEHALYALEPLD